MANRFRPQDAQKDRRVNNTRDPLKGAWGLWPSVSFSLNDLPKGITTSAIYKSFGMQGNITSIDIFEDKDGKPTGQGRIRFNPPPYHFFWANDYTVKFGNGRSARVKVKIHPCPVDNSVPSPARANVRYREKVSLQASQFAVGIQKDMSTINLLKGFAQSVKLEVNVRERALYIGFHEECPTLHGFKEVKFGRLHEKFRLKIPFSQLNKVWEVHNIPNPLDRNPHLVFIIILDHPGMYHRKLSDMTATFTENLSWKETDTWMRQTRISYDASREAATPTSLQRSGDIIDIGRWNVLKLTLETSDVNFRACALIHAILQDHNIAVQDGNHFREVQETPKPVWHCIDRQKVNPEWGHLGDLFDEHTVLLPFSVRYQLEVCISHGRLSEFNLNRDFIIRLMKDGNFKAQQLLEHVATHRQNYIDPMEIFKIKAATGVTGSKIPEYCCFMRTARVTPSTIKFNTPTVDTSNRITRKYSEFADRFLRVRFSDEEYLGSIRSTMSQVDDEIYKRVKATLANGISVGDRHYEFLAFGNSQFREHGAYFFASLPNLSAADIRAWMGQFNHIRNIAKYTSRLGQCFSTTRSVGACTIQTEQIPDIERNGYNFSDGVGKISKFLAQITANGLKISTPNGEPPSAFQFRLGGCKGMLVVSSELQPNKLHIRPSQHKFDSPHGSLEVIRWSSNSMATLNRQLILILAAMGIPKKIILNKQNSMLQNLHKAMTDDSQAISLLRRFVDPNHTTLTLADLVQYGFRRVNEPFVASMLSLWKAWHFKYLKEKAKILIEKGASLFSVLDETGVLQGWFDKKVRLAERSGAKHADKIAALPEVFVQVSSLDKNGAPKIIEGLCILARNPSLHPGDIRVVRAVNKPGLRHLIDVIVFPQTGDRDLASMCSGGDLDGDDYLIMWDPDLIPHRWFTRPMADDNLAAPELDRDVTVDDMTTFFVTFMKLNCLPRIANAHVAWADRLERGVHEQKCIKLAGMHSAAVDYNKTGRPAKMTWSLEPKVWPHFMEREAQRTYHSTKVLGRLYDAVEKIHFVPDLSIPFDSRILKCDLVPASETFMDFAMQLKTEYDAVMLRIMAQFEIKTEFEVWSTFVLNHSRIVKDYKLHEELGSITETLRDGFRQQSFDRVKGRSIEDVAPLVVAMYRVTHEVVTKALAERHGPALFVDDGSSHDASDELDINSNASNEKADLPLISFPWIFHEYLGKIALGQFNNDRLMAYQSGKISGKIYTHAEVKPLLLDQEQEVTDIASAHLVKMISNAGVHNRGDIEINVKEDLATPSKHSASGNSFSSGILIDAADLGKLSPSNDRASSYSLTDAVDEEVSLMTFDEDEDEDDKPDKAKPTVQEISETGPSAPLTTFDEDKSDGKSDRVETIVLRVDNHTGQNESDETEVIAQQVDDEADEADEVEVEIVETETPQSIFKHLLSLVGS